MNRRLLGPALVGLAGVLALLSYVLHWAKLTIGAATGSVVSSYIGYRRVGLISGLILVLGAFLSWRLRPNAARRWGLLGIIGGVFIGAYVVYEVTSEKSRALDHLAKSVAGLLGMSVDQARAAIDREVAKGLIKFSFTPGLWLALAAAALAIAGGLVTFLTRAERPDVAAPVRPDPGLAESEPQLRTTGLREAPTPGDGSAESIDVEGSGEGESPP